jgi:thioester reductase-like protein
MEKIAIVGLGCRLPGAKQPSEYWELLTQGVDAISEVPQNRWSIERYYHPEPQQPGKMCTRWGGFIDQIDSFDAGFFGISPKEAERMDPQHRLVLEVAWESLEEAGINPAELDGTRSGVFIGIGNYDYGRLLILNSELINAYDGLGNTLCIAANRISYFLNLRGPSLVLESACSSSLVSLHYACQSLQTGESDMCLVGGVSLMLAPEPTITYSHARMMSPTGRCRTFDAGADGYVRGEGCGIVVLKRLSDALSKGDNIRAVISGSAINQDGRSNGITAPNGLAQEAVIKDALLKAGISPNQVSYVEAHGTGTILGDPLELEALKKVYGEARKTDNRCAIGAVKTNIGHLEAASGIAGLIKVAMMLDKRQIPGNLHLKTINPYINLADSRLYFPSELSNWSTTDDLYYAGISSFGFGGTNVHVILESSPKTDAYTPILYNGNKRENPTISSQLFVVSAKSEMALQCILHSYIDNSNELNNKNLRDICANAARGRAHFDRRLAIQASSSTELLSIISNNQTQQIIRSKYQQTKKSPQIVFLFTGQGSQYPGMGVGLYETHKVFRSAINNCSEILNQWMNPTLIDILNGDQDKELINQTQYTQPAIFALEYALAQLWMSWGISPSLMIGHSLGEYVAATIANIFSLEDGLRLVVERGRLIQSLPAEGAMEVIQASKNIVVKYIKQHSGEVSIAAINGTNNCVISGDKKAVHNIAAQFHDLGIRTKSLDVSHAFHSIKMEKIKIEFAELTASVDYNSPQLPIMSTLMPGRSGDSMTNAEYWNKHLREPVLFHDGLNELLKIQRPCLIEIGPRPTLLGLASSFCAEREHEHENIPSLHPKRNDCEQINESLAKLYCLGARVNWQAIYPDQSYSNIKLPTYQFQREKYWLDIANYRSKTSPLIDSTLDRSLKETYVIEWLETTILPIHANSCTNSMDRSCPWLVIGSDGELCAKVIKILNFAQQDIRLFNCTNINKKPESSNLREILNQIPPGKHLNVILVAESRKNTRLDYQDNNLLEFQSRINETLKPLVDLIALAGSNGLIQSNRLKLTILTQTAYPIEPDEAIDPSLSPLWGYAKVLGLECPEILNTIIDLPNKVTPSILDNLKKLILGEHPESLLALRKNRCLAPRLRGNQMTNDKPLILKFEAKNSYLITGGLGAIGLQLAEWLIHHGATNLLLIGRSQPTHEQQDAIKKLNEAGGAIKYLSINVADGKAVESMISELTLSKFPLAGIFHCAGCTSYREVKDLTWSDFEEVLASKINGSWNLHYYTSNIPLDYFVTFSSIASIWGSRGQAHYAAANSFLDGLSIYREQLSLPITSINWGPWHGKGMANADFEEQLSKIGVFPLDSNKAFSILERMLASKRSSMVVANVDWQRFTPIYQIKARTNLLEGLAHEKCLTLNSTKVSGISTSERSPFLDEILSVNNEQRFIILRQNLAVIISGVLGYEDPIFLDPQASLYELGVDSLMSLDIVARIRSEICADFSFLEMSKSSNLNRMTGAVLQLLFPNDNIIPLAEPEIDLAVEALLPTDIEFNNHSENFNSLTSMGILLTGATGFLGAYLLHDLLTKTSHKIYCLVRTSDSESSRDRIILNLRHYNLLDGIDYTRIIPVAGDLTRPLLGIEPSFYEYLSNCINVIYHSAAILNFVFPYSKLKHNNVYGTEEIIRFSFEGTPKHLHYISTDAVFDSSAYYDKLVDEDELITHNEGIDLGYTQTKWVSESLVSEARRRGLLVTIYRPPLITGHSLHGNWNTNDFTCLFLKGCVQMKTIPDINTFVTFAPVDYVSNAIVSLSQLDNVSGCNYHLNNPHQTTWKQISVWIESAGYPLKTIPYHEWEEQLIQETQLNENILSPLLPFFLKKWSTSNYTFAELAVHRARLDCSNTADKLKTLNIVCPKIDRKLINRYFKYFNQTGFIIKSTRNNRISELN